MPYTPQFYLRESADCSKDTWELMIREHPQSAPQSIAMLIRWCNGWEFVLVSELGNCLAAKNLVQQFTDDFSRTKGEELRPIYLRDARMPALLFHFNYVTPAATPAAAAAPARKELPVWLL